MLINSVELQLYDRIKKVLLLKAFANNANATCGTEEKRLHDGNIFKVTSTNSPVYK